MTATIDQDLLDGVIRAACNAGADAADALGLTTLSVSAAQRLGKVERLERAESGDVGLRVFKGKSQASVSTSDLSRDGLHRLVEQAVGIASALPDDPYCGLAEAEQLAADWPDLDLFDPYEPDGPTLLARIAACEAAALDDGRISNSEGAEAGYRHSRLMLRASNGFAGGYATSSHSISCVVIAEQNGRMERDYDYASRATFADLPDPAVIGQEAARRTVARLGGRKLKTQTVPVVYDPRVSRSLLFHLVAGINGAAVARGTTLFKDLLDQPVFADGITVINDPLRPRGPRSAPFDAEGLPTARRALIEDGRLTTFLLDLAAARQLGKAPTGHAARGLSAPPSPSAHNLYMEPGRSSPSDLLADIKEGFYVTEMIGMGLNMLTGDYSRGASGFWIENGKITYPVSEMTIAGNLKNMLRRAIPANDLEFRYGIDAPTLRVDGLTVAGH